MKLITFIVPVAPYHLNLVGKALDSIRQQTLPCEYVLIEDTNMRGAGWARNEGLRQVETPFTAFLDADDWLEADYAKEMLRRYEQGYYVYCDDIHGKQIHATPDCEVYTYPESWHCVTALVATAHARHIGGFDETLPGMEDADFYLRLQASGVCGLRCPYPLVHYTLFGQRVENFKIHKDYAKIREYIKQRSYFEARQMCKCTDKVVNNGEIPGGQEGDIIVYAPTMLSRFFGRATGREYQRPRGVDNYRIKVHPRDQQADPKNLQLIDTYNPKDYAPSVDDIQRMVIEALQAS